MRIKEIDNSVRAHYADALKVLDGKNMFGVFLQGSQNYNLDIYTDEYRSDVDTKCIVLPSFEDFCKGNSPISTTYERENKEHIDLKDIRVMFDVFKKQNVNFVEILLSIIFCGVATTKSSLLISIVELGFSAMIEFSNWLMMSATLSLTVSMPKTFSKSLSCFIKKLNLLILYSSTKDTVL